MADVLLLFSFEGHTAPVNDVAFSNGQGDLMVSCSDDATIRVWIPMIHGEVRSIKGHSGPVRSVAFHPTTTTKFLSASDDKSVKVRKGLRIDCNYKYRVVNYY
jgi:WD40 repeat protein